MEVVVEEVTHSARSKRKKTKKHLSTSRRVVVPSLRTYTTTRMKTTSRRTSITSCTTLSLEGSWFVFLRQPKISSHRECVGRGGEEGQATRQCVGLPSLEIMLCMPKKTYLACCISRGRCPHTTIMEVSHPNLSPYSCDMCVNIVLASLRRKGPSCTTFSSRRHRFCGDQFMLRLEKNIKAQSRSDNDYWSEPPPPPHPTTNL